MIFKLQYLKEQERGKGKAWNFRHEGTWYSAWRAKWNDDWAEDAEITIPDEWVTSNQVGEKTYWNITKPKGESSNGNTPATPVSDLSQILKGMRELYRQLEELKQELKEIKDLVTVKF